MAPSGTLRIARESSASADALAFIAEYDARRLYAERGYSSMFAYCVHELRLSDDAAAKRIQVARVARQHPRIFELLADGRLNLSGVVLLAPRLRGDDTDALLEAAIHKTCGEIELILAGRFPRPDVGQPAIDLTVGEHAVRHVDSVQVVANTESDVVGMGGDPAAASTIAPAPAPAISLPPARLKPIAPGVYSLQVPIDQNTHDRLRHAQALLSHRVPSGDLSQVLDRALAALIAQLEKRKCGATARPRAPRESANPRHIPAHVRRAVWERDGGQCTYVSADGRRCGERRLVEFDHELEVARGGTASVGNLRLRCRTHNQHGAEQTFGAEFMRAKRAEAASRTHAKAARLACDEPTVSTMAPASPTGAREGQVPAESPAAAHPEVVRAVATQPAKAAVVNTADPDLDVVPWLRALRIGAREAREAAQRCVHEPGDTLEQRVRRALSFVGPRVGRTVPRVPA